MNVSLMDNYTIECTGEKEVEVFDIETENTHTFFANDILVHNSLYLSLERMVEENCKGMTESQIIDWIDNFSKTKLQNLLDDTFEKIRKYVGAPKNYIQMSREKIIETALWTGKKHYAYKMVDNDGVRLEKPKYGYKGLECIKSSTPRKIRDLMKYTINSILDGKNINEVIKECKSKIMELDPEDLAFPRTCNGITKYKMEGYGSFTKGAQAHVKAALVYNQYLEEHGITDYPKIEEGNKIRFLWLVEPNPFGSPTFGFINRLPKDENIRKYIDYETNYYKGYEKPIVDNILKNIGIENVIRKNLNLDDIL